MPEYIDVNQLWKCETCFWHIDGKCSPLVWCEIGESYRPNYHKFQLADVEPVIHATWEKIAPHKIVCSHCKEEPVYANLEGYILTKRCPNCGAKMNAEVSDNA